MALFVKRKDNNEKVKVRKYIIDSNGEESIWSDEWYGRHVIGLHCEWIDGSKIQLENGKLSNINKLVYPKCGCGGNLKHTEDGLVCDICG
jgi:hypothetical protein